MKISLDQSFDQLLKKEKGKQSHQTCEIKIKKSHQRALASDAKVATLDNGAYLLWKVIQESFTLCNQYNGHAQNKMPVLLSMCTNVLMYMLRCVYKYQFANTCTRCI